MIIEGAPFFDGPFVTRVNRDEKRGELGGTLGCGDARACDIDYPSRRLG